MCIENNGVILFNIENNELVKTRQLLPKELVSRVYKDKQGGYWFTTLNNGVFYMPSAIYTYYNYVAKSIEIDTINQNLYLGLTNKKVLQIPLSDIGNSEMELLTTQESSSAMCYDYLTNSLIAEGVRGELMVKNESKLYSIKKLLHANTKSMVVDGDIIYRVNGLGISKISLGLKKELYNSYSQGKYWCTSIVGVDKYFWIGTNEGLIKFDDKTGAITTPFKNHNILNSAITSLSKISNNIVLIGTKSYGLLLMKDEKIIGSFDDKNGLPSNLVKSLHVDNQNEIWVGTNKGLARIQNFGSISHKVQIITTKHGLISNEISAIKSCENYIYLATPKGLIVFDKTKILADIASPQIYITDFKVNSKSWNFNNTSQIQLTYVENIIDINFVSLNYKSLGGIEYMYRLNGIDTTWQTTTQRGVKFYELPDGAYNFEVKAKNEDGIWSNPTTLKFNIQPPFWITWWFILVEILICLGIIIFLFKYREKQLLLKNEKDRTISENEKKIVELELKALRSQMNPHFIFNTLNSIQLYISNNNFKDSKRYITNFSRLIRMVLNHSEKSTITLREEIDMLNLCVGLEKIRFDNQFEYQLKIDDELDLDCDRIPPMLLQPFIENAIWHGLMKKTEKGLIQVEMSVQNDSLICIVQDNGIGREAAEKIKEERKIKNKSVGMSITKERLNLMNSELYKGLNVELIDLFDNNNIACGTKVIVKIPLK